MGTIEECYELSSTNPESNTIAVWSLTSYLENKRHKIRETLLKKQGRTHKWCSSMNPYTWTCQYWPTSKNLFTSALCGQRMKFGRPAKSDGYNQDGWRERERFKEIRGVIATWRWWWWWWFPRHCVSLFNGIISLLFYTTPWGLSLYLGLVTKLNRKINAKDEDNLENLIDMFRRCDKTYPEKYYTLSTKIKFSLMTKWYFMETL